MYNLTEYLINPIQLYKAFHRISYSKNTYFETGICKSIYTYYRSITSENY